MYKKIVFVSCLMIIGLFSSGCIAVNSCGLKEGGKTVMSKDEAKTIAESSECGKEGLEKNWSCNCNTGTWWVDLKTKKEGCSPACVVDVEKKIAEINWRCTGLKK